MGIQLQAPLNEDHCPAAAQLLREDRGLADSERSSRCQHGRESQEQPIPRGVNHTRASWDGNGADTGQAQELGKGKLQTLCQQPQRAGSAGSPPHTGLHPEEEGWYRSQCCSAAIPNRGVALKTHSPVTSPRACQETPEAVLGFAGLLL